VPLEAVTLHGHGFQKESETGVGHCLVPGCSFEGWRWMTRVFLSMSAVWSERWYSAGSMNAGDLEEASEKKALSQSLVTVLPGEVAIGVW